MPGRADTVGQIPFPRWAEAAVRACPAESVDVVAGQMRRVSRGETPRSSVLRTGHVPPLCPAASGCPRAAMSWQARTFFGNSLRNRERARYVPDRAVRHGGLRVTHEPDAMTVSCMSSGPVGPVAAFQLEMLSSSLHDDLGRVCLSGRARRDRLMSRGRSQRLVRAAA